MSSFRADRTSSSERRSFDANTLASYSSASVLSVYHRFWLDYSGSETMHSIYEGRKNGSKVVLALAQEGGTTISLYISINFGFSEETGSSAETDESEDSDTSVEADESEKANTIETIEDTEAETGLGLSGLLG